MATTKKEKPAQPARGVKTTEFWLSLLAVLTGFVVSSGLADPDGVGTWDKVIGVVATLLAAMGYTTARTKVKVASEENK
tara:strand:+ start:9493 stop:9729 length:237 start_codon:yes stop_codon:yes gene_type:complete